ncbi:MAG: hypothetical protein SA339_13510 [Methanomassiliicoccus sp.]|nr:hypothetical protein [Methanomassiliicoccus sp.]
MDGEDGRVILKYNLWVRLFLILGVFFWVAIIVIAYVGSDSNMGPAWLILLFFISITLGPAINANLTWFAYDGQGIEWHNPLRKPVFILWDEISAIRPISNGWSIEGPGRKIKLSGDLKGVKELGQEIERRVPDEKFLRYHQ